MGRWEDGKALKDRRCEVVKVRGWDDGRWSGGEMT